MRYIAAGAGAVALLVAAAALFLSGGHRSPQPSAVSGAGGAPAGAGGLLARAERLITVQPADVGFTVRLAGPRPGLEGQINAANRVITLFVAPGEVAHRVAHDLAHELGHAYDLVHNSPADRAAYLARRGRPDAAWWPGRDPSDYAVGAGDFAEVFALCHAASPIFRSRLAPAPTDACAALPAAARADRLAAPRGSR